jgi:hypothetical protein
MPRTKTEEITRNFEQFRKVLPDLLADRQGEYALIRHGKIRGFFDSALDAQIAGNSQFDDQLFSIQCVKDAAEELGYFTYALETRGS